MSRPTQLRQALYTHGHDLASIVEDLTSQPGWIMLVGMVELLKIPIEAADLRSEDHHSVEGFTPRVEELLKSQPLNPLQRLRIFELTSLGKIVAIES